MWRVRHSQDGNNCLTALPPHLLNVLNGRDQITSTARANEESIPFNKEPGHTHRLGVRYPNPRETREKRDVRQRQSSLDHSFVSGAVVVK